MQRIEHERERRELWRRVAAAIAGCPGASDKDAMRMWANHAVNAYDERFKLQC